MFTNMYMMYNDPAIHSTIHCRLQLIASLQAAELISLHVQLGGSL